MFSSFLLNVKQHGFSPPKKITGKKIYKGKCLLDVFYSSFIIMNTFAIILGILFYHPFNERFIF